MPLLLQYRERRHLRALPARVQVQDHLQAERQRIEAGGDVHQPKQSEDAGRRWIPHAVVHSVRGRQGCRLRDARCCRRTGRTERAQSADRPETAAHGAIRQAARRRSASDRLRAYRSRIHHA